MAEQDEGGWEDRLLMVGHDEVVALVLPHQIRNGLHLQVHIAGQEHRDGSDEDTGLNKDPGCMSSWQ